MNDDIQITRVITRSVVGVILLLVALAVVACWAIPAWNVWRAEKSGEAVYAEAESSRRVKTLEAQATKDSAKLLGEADVERAKGAAEANRILGESLKNNEQYLRYLWIQSLMDKTSPTIIYVPTEAGLPILEAQRVVK